MANKYTVVLQPLSEADGGGWMATIPELPGCMSDGETPKEAAENVEGAIVSWLEEAERLGHPVPLPGSTVGQWSQRVPKSLHIELKQIAQAEGVSLNSLVTTIIASDVARRRAA